MPPVPATPYQMAINNVARYIRNHPAGGRDDSEVVTAFEASTVLSIAFCKSKEEMLASAVGGEG